MSLSWEEDSKSGITSYRIMTIGTGSSPIQTQEQSHSFNGIPMAWYLEVTRCQLIINNALIMLLVFKLKNAL